MERATCQHRVGSTNRTPLSIAVVQAVSSRVGVPVEELENPLFDVIDPDALDTLFQGAEGTVTFEYAGVRVTADHANMVTVDPLE